MIDIDSAKVFFAECQRIVEDRKERWCCTEGTCFDQLGRIWAAEITIHMQTKGFTETIPDLPAWLVSVMLGSLKMQRLTVNPTYKDSYLDLAVYSFIASTEKHNE